MLKNNHDVNTIYEKRNHLLLTPKKKDKTKQKVQIKKNNLARQTRKKSNKTNQVTNQRIASARNQRNE